MARRGGLAGSTIPKVRIQMQMLSTRSVYSQLLASPAEIIEEARQGRMYILVDSPDRENEGDLIIPAEHATPEAINFMARHGRGLICLALEQEQARSLGLKAMAPNNGSRFETAFTQSIEAREGITTGISAADRSRTVLTAIGDDATAQDIVSPGHMFPIVARDGGVLVRAGHTEASVDISRMAGLNPSAVICEIMKDDGSMARLPDLIDFAGEHGLKIGTIEDLIKFRMKRDHFVRHVASSEFVSQDGDRFRLHVYRNYLDGMEHVALSKGEPVTGEESLVRVHKIDFAGDVLHEDSPRSGLIRDALHQLARYPGHSVLVLIREGTINSLLERMGAPVPPPEIDRKELTIRYYGIGTQMLAHQGVRKMRLITNKVPKVIGLDAYNIELTGTTPIQQH